MKSVAASLVVVLMLSGVETATCFSARGLTAACFSARGLAGARQPEPMANMVATVDAKTNGFMYDVANQAYHSWYLHDFLYVYLFYVMLFTPSRHGLCLSSRSATSAILISS